jgi:hypothetical protein
VIAVRRHGSQGWQWTRSYSRDGTPRYAVPRRSSWDLRCEERDCPRVAGRMTLRRAPRRRRWRAGQTGVTSTW